MSISCASRKVFSHYALLLEEPNGRRMVFHFHERKDDRQPCYQTFSYNKDRLSGIVFVGKTKLRFVDVDDLCRGYTSTDFNPHTADNINCMWPMSLFETLNVQQSFSTIPDDDGNCLYEIYLLSDSPNSALDSINDSC